MAWTTRAQNVTCRKYLIKQPCVAFAALALISPAFGNDMPWPQVRVPQQVETIDVGQEVAVNGMRARIRCFVSHANPTELAASFRQLLGQPLMEDQRGSKLILGRAEGRYYVTVQLDPLGSGTRGVIAVTKPLVDQEAPADTAAVRRLLSSLPPGSMLTNHTSSVDGKVHADHDAVTNDHSTGINAEYVQRMLRADGFILERDSSSSQSDRARSSVAHNARTLFFKRAGAEATAVLFNDTSGKSVIVINQVYLAGPAK